MTTGTIGSTAGIGYGPGGYYKTWSGTNGRYETVGGVKRDKWNNYTLTLLKQDGVRMSDTTPQRYIAVNVEPDWNNTWRPYHEAELQGKLVSAVRGHDFNLAVNAAQGTKTVDMVVQNLGAIGRAVGAARRGDFATAARNLGVKPRKSRLDTGDISGRWLELQYGWLPLLGDVFEAGKAYEEIVKKRTIRVIVRKSVSGVHNGSASPSNWSGWGTYVHRKRIECELSEDLSVPRTLGLLDPMTVAWEIIPYSFVVDWFIPIGTFLDNLSIIPVLRGRFLTTTTRIYNNSGSSPASNIYYRGATSSYHCVRIERTLTGSLGAAFPSFIPLPDAMSPKRVWNAIGLAHQAVHSRR